MTGVQTCALPIYFGGLAIHYGHARIGGAKVDTDNLAHGLWSLHCGLSLLPGLFKKHPDRPWTPGSIKSLIKAWPKADLKSVDELMKNVERSEAAYGQPCANGKT